MILWPWQNNEWHLKNQVKKPYYNSNRACMHVDYNNNKAMWRNSSNFCFSNDKFRAQIRHIWNSQNKMFFGMGGKSIRIQNNTTANLMIQEFSLVFIIQGAVPIFVAIQIFVCRIQHVLLLLFHNKDKIILKMHTHISLLLNDRGLGTHILSL